MQSVTIGSTGLRLEAAIHYPAGRSHTAAAVVCHPHPQRGGDMRNSVVAVIVRGLNAAGVVAVTFNFRGVGASEGSFDNGAGEQDDVRAVLKYARQMPGIEKVALAGYSFGAGMAANVVDASVERLGLVAIPTRQLEAPALNSYEGPVLFATGSLDEISSLDAVGAKAAAFGDRATLEGVSGADHFWWGNEEQLAEAVRDFFAPIVAAPQTSA
jgi:alpha/beta superfamily hydrolase